MKAARRKAVEARFGLAFPDDWATWEPETERELVRGVAALFAPEEYAEGERGAVVIGTTTEGSDLGFVRAARKPELRPAVYELAAGKPRKLVEQFSELLIRARRAPARPDERLYEQRMMWAAQQLGEWRSCPTCSSQGPRRTCACGTEVGATAAVATRNAAELASAREALPDLFAAIDFVLRWRAQLPWLGDSASVLALETARQRKTPLETIVQRWTDRYGIERTNLPIEDLRALLGGLGRGGGDDFGG